MNGAGTQAPEMSVALHVGGLPLAGDLVVPAGARGVVVFAHGSGSSHLSPRNQAVAARLREGGLFGTLLFDLLTPTEDARTATRFDIELLTERLLTGAAWLSEQLVADGLPVAYFGASTGAAAALRAAATGDARVRAVVSRGGRPDLAGAPALTAVRVPTLLIVGGADPQVIALNRQAAALLGGDSELEIVPGATHLFEEPGAIEQVGDLTRSWLERYLH